MTSEFVTPHERVTEGPTAFAPPAARRCVRWWVVAAAVSLPLGLHGQGDKGRRSSAPQLDNPDQVQELILKPGADLNALQPVFDWPASGLLKWASKRAPWISQAAYRSNGTLQRDRWLAIVRLLIEKGADINLPDDLGHTPLMWASMPGPAESPQGDLFNWTPGDAQAMEILLAVGAKVDETDQRGATALHYAALFGPAPKVSLLITKGAKINVPDIEGDTPLIYAAGRRVYGLNAMYNTHSLRLLIGAGADTGVKNTKGQTALSRSKKGSYIEALLTAKSQALTIPEGRDFRPSDQAKALVFVYREPYTQGSLLKPAVYFDDRDLARLPNGRFFGFESSPGEHTLKFDRLDRPAAKVEFQSNHVYYIRVWNPWGAVIEQLPHDEGWFTIEHTRAIDAGYIKERGLVILAPPRGR